MAESDKSDKSTNLEFLAGIVSLIMLMLALPTLHITCFPDNKEVLPVLFWLSMLFTISGLAILFEKVVSSNRSNIGSEQDLRLFRGVIRGMYSVGIALSLVTMIVNAGVYVMDKVLSSLSIPLTLVFGIITIVVTIPIFYFVQKRDKKT